MHLIEHGGTQDRPFMLNDEVVTLSPGNNFLTEAQWQAAQKDRKFQRFLAMPLDRGGFKHKDQAAVIEAGIEAVANGEHSINAYPENLANMIIWRLTDRAKLAEIAESADRSIVQEAARRKIYRMDHGLESKNIGLPQTGQPTSSKSASATVNAPQQDASTATQDAPDPTDYHGMLAFAHDNPETVKIDGKPVEGQPPKEDLQDALARAGLISANYQKGGKKNKGSKS